MINKNKLNEDKKKNTKIKLVFSPNQKFNYPQSQQFRVFLSNY